MLLPPSGDVEMSFLPNYVVGRALVDSSQTLTS